MLVVASTISITLVTATSVGQGVNAVLATTTKSATTTTPNGNNINCQSKNGSADTQTSLGNLRFAAGKCTGENGGTVSAGGVKSNSGAIGMHGTNGPNGNSHVGGFIKR